MAKRRLKRWNTPIKKEKKYSSPIDVQSTMESWRKVTNISQNVGTVRISSPVEFTTTSNRDRDPFLCKYDWSTDPEACVIKILEIDSYTLEQYRKLTFQSDFVPISINSSFSKGDGREFMIIAAIAPDDSIYLLQSSSQHLHLQPLYQTSISSALLESQVQSIQYDYSSKAYRHQKDRSPREIPQ